MSEISFYSRTSGSNGTATARAIEKTTHSTSSQAQAAREARIAELRKQVESGNYRIDAAEVGAAIVSQHIDLLG